MTVSNPWRFCDTENPPEYVRIQIKDRYNTKYVGYRCKHTYYEAIGNYVIKQPFQWRYIPVGSYLWAEIKDKIKSLSYGGEEETVYGCDSSQ